MSRINVHLYCPGVLKHNNNDDNDDDDNFKLNI